MAQSEDTTAAAPRRPLSVGFRNKLSGVRFPGNRSRLPDYSLPRENKYRSSVSSRRFGETRPAPESAGGFSKRNEGRGAPAASRPRGCSPRAPRSTELQPKPSKLRPRAPSTGAIAAHQGRPAHLPRAKPKARPAAHWAKPRGPAASGRSTCRTPRPAVSPPNPLCERVGEQRPARREVATRPAGSRRGRPI